MMEETKEEMDKAILTCTEFDTQTVAINAGVQPPGQMNMDKSGLKGPKDLQILGKQSRQFAKVSDDFLN